ncbi:hypothetical protein B0H19DRAFT_1064163 [Mycena capillaripes]|nr:hypothetical protein B0H19DRAFT_1064163 [Mycena capillaripes]
MALPPLTLSVVANAVKLVLKAPAEEKIIILQSASRRIHVDKLKIISRRLLKFSRSPRKCGQLSLATLNGTWEATVVDPLFFTLALLCGGAITLQNTVERGSPTNVTGQVSYGTRCLGRLRCAAHDPCPQPTFEHRQSPLCGGADNRVRPTITCHFRDATTTLLPTALTSSPLAMHPDHTFIILSAVLGAAGRLILLYVYVRRRHFSHPPRLMLRCSARMDIQSKIELESSALMRQLAEARAEVARLWTSATFAGGNRGSSWREGATHAATVVS